MYGTRAATTSHVKITLIHRQQMLVVPSKWDILLTRTSTLLYFSTQIEMGGYCMHTAAGIDTRPPLSGDVLCVLIFFVHNIMVLSHESSEVIVENFNLQK